VARTVPGLTGMRGPGTGLAHLNLTPCIGAIFSDRVKACRVGQRALHGTLSDESPPGNGPGLGLRESGSICRRCARAKTARTALRPQIAHSDPPDRPRARVATGGFGPTSNGRVPRYVPNSTILTCANCSGLRQTPSNYSNHPAKRHLLIRSAPVRARAAALTD
jgi:hypothetical protein